MIWKEEAEAGEMHHQTSRRGLVGLAQTRTWPAAGRPPSSLCASGLPPLCRCTAGRTSAGRTAAPWLELAALWDTGSRGFGASWAPRLLSAPHRNAFGTLVRCGPTSSGTSCLKTTTKEKMMEQTEEELNAKSDQKWKNVDGCIPLYREGEADYVRWARLTIQQVSGTQVNVDAGMEAGNEAIESPFLHTLTWDRQTALKTLQRRLVLTFPNRRDVRLPSSQLWKIFAVMKPNRGCWGVFFKQTNCKHVTHNNRHTVTSWAAVQHIRNEWTLDGERPVRDRQIILNTYWEDLNKCTAASKSSNKRVFTWSSSPRRCCSRSATPPLLCILWNAPGSAAGQHTESQVTPRLHGKSTCFRGVGDGGGVSLTVWLLYYHPPRRSARPRHRAGSSWAKPLWSRYWSATKAGFRRHVGAQKLFSRLRSLRWRDSPQRDVYGSEAILLFAVGVMLVCRCWILKTHTNTHTHTLNFPPQWMNSLWFFCWCGQPPPADRLTLLWEDARTPSGTSFCEQMFVLVGQVWTKLACLKKEGR